MRTSPQERTHPKRNLTNDVKWPMDSTRTRPIRYLGYEGHVRKRGYTVLPTFEKTVSVIYADVINNTKLVFCRRNTNHRSEKKYVYIVEICCFPDVCFALSLLKWYVLFEILNDIFNCCISCYVPSQWPKNYHQRWVIRWKTKTMIFLVRPLTWVKCNLCIQSVRSKRGVVF